MRDKTKTAGAVKAGDNGYLFSLGDMTKIDAGTGYSTAHGPVVEGDRIQVGLMLKPRGTGARPHKHPNEQWNYVLQGRLRVHIEGEEERIVGPGTLIYFPAEKVHATVALPDEDVMFLAIKDMSHGIVGRHATVALPDEDVMFLAIKDMSHGIVGMAADGTMAGPHYDPGFEPEGQT